MSSVTFMEECPSISETTLALMSFESSSVAQVWRRSWKRIGDRPAFFKSGLKERFLRFEGFDYCARLRGEDEPAGWQREPIRSISSSWRERCARRAATAPIVNLMVRRLLFVFGSPRT